MGNTMRRIWPLLLLAVVSTACSSPEAPAPAAPVALERAAEPPGDPVEGLRVATRVGCNGCHGVGSKILGPAFRDVARRYKDDKGAESGLAARIRNGGSGAWGDVPMPPQAQVSDADVSALVKWILSGSPEN